MMKWTLLGIVCAGMLAGCVPESNVHERQDAAMRDPYNYSPFDDQKTPSDSRPKKESIGHDVNSLFNP